MRLERLQINALCRGCGYDLLTIRIGAACPECGRPVVSTMVEVADATALDTLWITEHAIYKSSVAVSRYSSFLQESVLLVFRARRFAFLLTRPVKATPVPPTKEVIDARRQCLGLRYFFFVQFGEEADLQLRHHGLDTRDAVGRLVHMAAAFGGIYLGKDETIDTYRSAQCPDPCPREAGGDGSGLLG